ncbi:hypothetical protein [Paraclostridium bifermentans]|uniref:hypothetical protein n=1 Tax=Paraclostridium bifermentans TaxID=1490 RepID=UPI00359CB7EA
MGFSNKNYDYKHFNEYDRKCDGYKKDNSCCKPPTNSVNKYKHYADIDGEKHCIANKNYYDNYYTRYNHYYITDYNYVTDHYFDYNIYHYDTKTIYNECQYMGCENIIHHCKNDCCHMDKPHHPHPNYGHDYDNIPPMNKHHDNCHEKCNCERCCKRNLYY